jgi:serine/threonine protein kinase
MLHFLSDCGRTYQLICADFPAMNSCPTFSKIAIQQLISEEKTSRVYKGLDRASEQEFAVKVPKFGNVQTSQEAAILPMLSHPQIIELKDVIATDNGPCLIFPFAHGGDLFNHILSGALPESDAQAIFYNVIQAVNYLHMRDIWHRDLKPENILFMTTKCGPDSVVLTDFGFADEFPSGICDSKFCGSRNYAAPELHLIKPYTSAVDIWSLGVSLYVSLTASFPFDTRVSTEEILNGLPRLFQLGVIPEISASGQELVRWMLHPVPEDRPTAKQVLEHSWFDSVRNRQTSEGETEFLSQELDAGK